MTRFGGVLAMVAVLALGALVAPPAAQALGPFSGNFAFYDDFASLLLDWTRWLPNESLGSAAAPSTDTFRGIVLTKTGGPQAQLMLHSWGNQGAGISGGFRTQQRLDFRNSQDITAIIALVTVTGKPTAVGCTANTDTTTRARAQVIGRVFNLGAGPPSDQTGDVIAGIQLIQDSLTKAHIEAFVVSCADGACNSLTDHLPPGAGLFTTTWAANQPRYYGIQWDQANHQLIAAVMDQNFNTIESRAFDYQAAGLSDAQPPFLQRKSLAINNTAANCTPPGKRTEANMTAAFDNVFVNQ
jgi:hypothetical protein